MGACASGLDDARLGPWTQSNVNKKSKSKKGKKRYNIACKSTTPEQSEIHKIGAPCETGRGPALRRGSTLTDSGRFEILENILPMESPRNKRVVSQKMKPQKDSIPPSPCFGTQKDKGNKFEEKSVNMSEVMDSESENEATTAETSGRDSLVESRRSAIWTSINIIDNLGRNYEE